MMCLHYLVKLSIRILQVQFEMRTEKHTKIFLSYLLQNETDSDKV